MPSFYYSQMTLDSDLITIDNDEFHHIVNVFRLKVGDSISFTNGKGLLSKGVIKEITKKKITINITEHIDTNPSETKIACAFSLIKNKNDLLIVEKLTELGVQDLFPMLTVNSVKQSKENTLDKYKKTAINAIKQCDNPFLPYIHTVSNLELVIKKMIELDYIPIVASELKPESTLISIFQKPETRNLTPNLLPSTFRLPPSYAILIGPEGGFDKSEYDLFDRYKIPQISLGNNILRAETAAICAVSQMILLKLQKPINSTEGDIS